MRARIVTNSELTAAGVDWRPWDTEANLETIRRLGYMPIVRTDSPGFYHFPCPGCGGLCALDDKIWSITGPDEAPTVYASIKHVDCPAGFHVFVTNGEFPWPNQ